MATDGVLIVEDEPGIRSWLRIALGMEGYTVFLAADGEEAVEIYRERQDAVGVVLLDMQMPGMGGPKTAQSLRDINPAVRCCFMSGYSLDHKVLQGAGFGFLRKPFTAEDLV